jgi:hypothetical protein
MINKIYSINSFDKWKAEAKDSPYLRPVFLLHEYLKNNISDELLGFYIHGSLATLDYIKGYSDLDAVMIINDEISDNKKKVLEKQIKIINRFPYLIDVLQHHKITILHSSELLKYDRTDFPPVLFESSVALGNSRLTLEIGAAEVDYKKAFLDFYNSFRNNFSKENRSSLDLKAFLSFLQLFPAIYLQAKNNEFIGKKESFHEAEKYFKEEWEIINVASNIRREWNYSPIFSPFVQNVLLRIPRLERIMWFFGKLMPVPARIKKILGEGFKEKSFKLIELMKNKLYG